MPDKVEVTVAPTALTVAAGDTVETSATLRNLGQTVDQLTISIDGLDPGWYTLPVSSVALFPNDQDNLKIILHPPKTAETEAGSYPFRINVASQENPEEIATVDLTLEIRTLPEMEVSLSPTSVTGRKGVFQIIIHNPGDSAARLQLEASDAQGILQYHLQPGFLTVPGGGRSQSNLEVRLGWMSFFGGEKAFDFQVAATLPETEETKTVDGQLVRLAWYKIFQQIPVPPIRLPRIRLPWLEKPPVIDTFRATTEDRCEFKLSWSVKRAVEVKLNDEEVEPQGEMVLTPTEMTSYVLAVSNKYGSSSKTVDIQPRPLPVARASEGIRVSLSPSELQLQAGGPPLPIMVQVQNLGEIVDKFLVEVEGLDEPWYGRSASSIALMPQATDQVQISFHPPKKKGIKAKAYPFAVTVRSQSTPEEASSVTGQIEVQPAVEFKLKAAPYRVSCRRKGTFRINLANAGVSDVGLFLEATDLDEGLRFKFKNEEPAVTAWDSIEVPMIARPKRGSMVGERKRYDITVTATTADGNSQTVNCELNHRPFIGSWRPILRVMRAVIILGIIALVVYFVLDLGGGLRVLSSSPQTWLNQLIRTVEGWFFR